MEEHGVFQQAQMRRRPQDFMFPLRYFRARIKELQAVPAYFYHQVEEEEFALICEQINLRKFRTLTFGELLEHDAIRDPAVLLSFDDGWSSVWSIAFPLAKQHGIRFTLFINPMYVEDSEECRPTIEDGVDLETLLDRDSGSRCMLTWGEVNDMHISGLVDVQSHSLHHGVVFISDRLSGFSTAQGSFPMDGVIPLVSRIGGEDLVSFSPPLGTPLYPSGPALASPQRFIEDWRVREQCIALVKDNGGVSFFNEKGWKDALHKIVSQGKGGKWESEAGRRERFRNDLSLAKHSIEERLLGAHVRAVAMPWGAMHPQVPRIARDTGHELCILAYPFPDHFTNNSPLPLYPRLFGDAIWTLLDGPIRGGLKWWQARRRNIARRAAGITP